VLVNTKNSTANVAIMTSDINTTYKILSRVNKKGFLENFENVVFFEKRSCRENPDVDKAGKHKNPEI